VEKHTTIAVDLSKTVFEIAVSDQPGRVRESKRLSRLRRWALAIASRRGHNRAATAVANKLARIAWATAVRTCDYHSQTAA
jgi:hypothetical protein